MRGIGFLVSGGVANAAIYSVTSTGSDSCIFEVCPDLPSESITLTVEELEKYRNDWITSVEACAMDRTQAKDCMFTLGLEVKSSYADDSDSLWCSGGSESLGIAIEALSIFESISREWAVDGALDSCLDLSAVQIGDSTQSVCDADGDKTTATLSDGILTLPEDGAIGFSGSRLSDCEESTLETIVVTARGSLTKSGYANIPDPMYTVKTTADKCTLLCQGLDLDTEVSLSSDQTPDSYLTEWIAKVNECKNSIDLECVYTLTTKATTSKGDSLWCEEGSTLGFTVPLDGYDSIQSTWTVANSGDFSACFVPGTASYAEEHQTDLCTTPGTDSISFAPGSIILSKPDAVGFSATVADSSKCPDETITVTATMTKQTYDKPQNSSIELVQTSQGCESVCEGMSADGSIEIGDQSPNQYLANWRSQIRRCAAAAPQGSKCEYRIVATVKTTINDNMWCSTDTLAGFILPVSSFDTISTEWAVSDGVDLSTCFAPNAFQLATSSDEELCSSAGTSSLDIVPGKITVPAGTVGFQGTLTGPCPATTITATAVSTERAIQQYYMIDKSGNCNDICSRYDGVNSYEDLGETMTALKAWGKLCTRSSSCTLKISFVINKQIVPADFGCTGDLEDLWGFQFSELGAEGITFSRVIDIDRDVTECISTRGRQWPRVLDEDKDVCQSFSVGNDIMKLTTSQMTLGEGSVGYTGKRQSGDTDCSILNDVVLTLTGVMPTMVEFAAGQLVQEIVVGEIKGNWKVGEPECEIVEEWIKLSPKFRNVDAIGRIVESVMGECMEVQPDGVIVPVSVETERSSTDTPACQNVVERHLRWARVLEDTTRYDGWIHLYELDSRTPLNVEGFLQGYGLGSCYATINGFPGAVVDNRFEAPLTAAINFYPSIVTVEEGVSYSWVWTDNIEYRGKRLVEYRLVSGEGCDMREDNGCWPTTEWSVSSKTPEEAIALIHQQKCFDGQIDTCVIGLEYRVNSPICTTESVLGVPTLSVSVFDDVELIPLNGSGNTLDLSGCLQTTAHGFTSDVTYSCTVEGGDDVEVEVTPDRIVLSPSAKTMTSIVIPTSSTCNEMPAAVELRGTLNSIGASQSDYFHYTLTPSEKCNTELEGCKDISWAEEQTTQWVFIDKLLERIDGCLGGQDTECAIAMEGFYGISRSSHSSADCDGDVVWFPRNIGLLSYSPDMENFRIVKGDLELVERCFDIEGSRASKRADVCARFDNTYGVDIPGFDSELKIPLPDTALSIPLKISEWTADCDAIQFGYSMHRTKYGFPIEFPPFDPIPVPPENPEETTTAPSSAEGAFTSLLLVGVMATVIVV